VAEQSKDDDTAGGSGVLLPDLLHVMDLEQEKLARRLGAGHRVIHGVAGSGKTMILGYRCLHLARELNKPILVLCYNVALAARLRAYIEHKGIVGRISVRHFHGWCQVQLKMYHVAAPAPGEN
jgi:superfamily I DNA and RNA helicase